MEELKSESVFRLWSVVDPRKGAPGLCAFVGKPKEDSLYLFISRKRSLQKFLSVDNFGIWLGTRTIIASPGRGGPKGLGEAKGVLPEAYRARIFMKLAGETAELAVKPAWYNTATNNCTSSLIQYVNENEPGAIPFHYSYVLTGKIDDYLKELGYMDPTVSLDITRQFLSQNSLR